MLTFRSKECLPKFSSSKIKLDFMRGQYFSTFLRKLTKPKNTFFIGSALEEEEEEGETATNIRRRQRQTGDKVQEIKFNQSFYDEMLFGKKSKKE
jgi:hypothetical protein